MSRKQIMIFVIAFAVLYFLVCWSIVKGQGQFEGYVAETVVVRRGDTLWGYAGTYADETMDKQAYVLKVMELNGLETAAIYPGDRLVVMRYQQ